MGGIAERFPLRAMLTAVIGFLLGLLTNVASTYLQNDPFILSATIALFLLVLFIYVVWMLRTPNTVRVHFGHPTTLRKDDQALYAREGLVAFVSMYKPERGTSAEQLSSTERLEAAKRLDYAALDLENSNLETTIHAIRTHSDKLKHCWLIGTWGDTPDRPGSAAYIPVIKEYVRRELGIDCIFHDGQKYHVSIDDDEQIYKKTYDVLQLIFKEAEKTYHLAADHIVVDFTSGIRSMGLGAILASLDGERDIEFVGANYTAVGQIEPHKLFTMIFNFEAVLPRS